MRSPGHSPFLIALAFRLLNALISRSFFQPDEYWQSLEVAHLWVFKYGYKTWEWRAAAGGVGGAASWDDWKGVLKDGGKGGIRSPLSVLPTVALYKLIQLLGVDDAGDWLVLAPRLLQACIAASADVAVRQSAENVLGLEYGNAALLVSLTSFFNFFTSTRTFSNSTETALTIWALRWWPWDSYSPSILSTKDSKDENKSNHETSRHASSLPVALVFAALATIIRPSNAVIWLTLGSRLFLQTSTRRRVSIIVSASLVSITAILVSLFLDTLFYDTPTFTPLRFLTTNVFHSISLFYGQNPWHFYLFQGIPILLLTQLPFFLDGIRKFYLQRTITGLRNSAAMNELRWTALGTVVCYSLLSHKEWRFLHPILPIFHLFVTISLVSSFRSSSQISSVPKPPFKKTSTTLLHPFERLAFRSRIKFSHLFILSFSFVPGVYLTAFHTRGQNDVVLWLRDEMRIQRSKTSFDSRGRRKEEPDKIDIESIGFAMPCHSTPWQSHLHSPELEGRIWFIGCEPPVLGQPQDIYLDQSDHFYFSPSTYFLTRFPPTSTSSLPPSPPRSNPYALPPDLPSTLQARKDLIDKNYDLGWTYPQWPTHLVLFKNLLAVPCQVEEDCKDIRGLLVEKVGYRVVKEFWNGVGGWHEDERRKGGVAVLALPPQVSTSRW